MIRNITEKDAFLIKQRIGLDIQERNDIDYNHSGISFNDDGDVDSIIIFGTRTLTDYFNGNIPEDDYMDDTSGSEEIIAFYSTDGTDNDMYKSFLPFSEQLGYMSQMWYIPKNEEDCIKINKCIRMTKCKNHNIMVKRQWFGIKKYNQKGYSGSNPI